MTTPSTSRRSQSPEEHQTWQEAARALLIFKASRDPLDREHAVAKLYLLALKQAEIIVKKRVDNLLPAHKRRNPEQMAADAASSILYTPRKGDKRTGLTVLADTFDPDRASLYTLMARIISNKITDYVRKEPMPGVLGRSVKSKDNNDKPSDHAGPAASPLADEPLSDDDVAATLADFANTPHAAHSGRAASTLITGPDATDAGDGTGWGTTQGSTPELSHDDQHDSLQILGMIKNLLPADEYDVFVCAFDDLTLEEGLAHINSQHPAHEKADGTLSPHMSLATYKRKLSQAKKTLAALYPK